MIQEHSIAPDFSLQNAEKETISLSQFKGHWIVLYFYPKDDTPGCTAEACAFRDNFPFYEDVGIKVLGISKDSPESHRLFKEKYKLPFELLSDSDGAISELYGAGVGDTPKRISYLIAPDGTIARSYKTVLPATHAEEVLADLKKLQH